jgi:membrane fusion protein, multidrug efflux system
MTPRLLLGLALVVLAGGAAYGVHAWRYASAHVWTDDAYVEGTVSPVSAKVAGHVVELPVEEHQAVKKGDLLLRIDPRDYEAKRDQTRAAVAVAEASWRAARSEIPLAREATDAQREEAQAALEAAAVAERSSAAAVEEALARIEARRAGLAAIRAEVGGARSASRKAQRELDRMRRLVTEGYVSQREFDQAEEAADSAAAGLEAAERRVSQAEREVQQAEAELATRRLAVAQAHQRVVEARATLARARSQRHQVPVKEAEAGRAEARLREARADLAYAELQLQHTVVRAPVDGIVSKRGVELGQVAQVGQPLMAIVPLHDVWVVANFKETQLARLRPGLAAEVRVDGAPGRTYRGTVTSISAGTGARFSLLPPENATGNWVKVVQRVPVKIRLAPETIGNPHTLRAGMSAVVTIRVEP